MLDTRTLHFQVLRSMRRGLNRHRPTPIADLLCGEVITFSQQSAAIEEFETRFKNGEFDSGLWPRGPTRTILCERCVVLYGVAKANGIPVRHQRLDHEVRKILEVHREVRDARVGHSV